MPDLRQEERRKRNRRLSFALGGLSVLLVLIGGLLIYNTILLSEANRNLAEALAARSVLVTAEKEPYKAAVYLSEARRRYASPRWNAVSLLVGPPIAKESGRIVLAGQVSEIHYVPGSNSLAVVKPSGISIADLETGKSVALAGSAGFGQVRIDVDGKKLIARNGNEIETWNLASSASPAVEAFSADRPGSSGVVAFGLAVNQQTGELAYGCPDGWVRLRSLRTGKPTKAFGPLSDFVQLVAISPNGRYLAGSAGNSQVVRLWDLVTGRQTDLNDKNFILYDLEFSPDSRHLAASGTDGVAPVWNTATGEVELEARGHAGNIPTLAFSPDSTLLATGGSDSTIRLWSLAHATEVVRLEMPDGDMQSVVFSPDGELVAGATATDVTFWSLDGRDALGPTMRHDAGPSSISFSPDGKKVALAGTLGVIWADRSGLNPFEIRRLIAFAALGLEPPHEPGPGYDAAGARLVDPRDGRDVVRLDGSEGIAAVAVGGSGTVLAGGDSSGHVNLWDMSTGKQLRVLRAPQSTVRCLAFDGGMVAAGYDRAIRVWSLAADLSIVHVFDLPLPASWSEASCQSLTISPDRKLLATTTYQGEIEIWETQTGRPLLASPQLSALPVLFSPDLSRILFRAADGRLSVSSSQAPSKMGEPFAGGIAKDTGLLFSPDGSLLTVDRGGAVEIWEPSARRLRARLARGGRPMAFDPSGEVLVTNVKSISSLEFWNAATGEPIGTLKYEENPNTVLFSPDASVLLLEQPGIGEGEVRLRQASPAWSADEAERMSGFRLRGLALEHRPPAVGGVATRVGSLDLAAAEFWRAVWQVQANLARTPKGGTEGVRSAAEPLRRWMAAHPGHRLYRDATKQLEELLPLPQTWTLDTEVRPGTIDT